MNVALGDEVGRRREAVGAVERVVNVRTGEPVLLSCLANHRVPGIEDVTRCVRGFGRKVDARQAEPEVVRVDRPEDGWLSSSQGNDLGEDVLELRAEDLRRLGRTGRVVPRPVGGIASRTVARVIVTVPGCVVVGNADNDDVRIGECMTLVGVGLQFFEETVDLESGKVGEILDFHRVASCL